MENLNMWFGTSRLKLNLKMKDGKGGQDMNDNGRR